MPHLHKASFSFPGLYHQASADDKPLTHQLVTSVHPKYYGILQASVLQLIEKKIIKSVSPYPISEGINFKVTDPQNVDVTAIISVATAISAVNDHHQHTLERGLYFIYIISKQPVPSGLVAVLGLESLLLSHEQTDQIAEEREFAELSAAKAKKTYSETVGSSRSTSPNNMLLAFTNNNPDSAVDEEKYSKLCANIAARNEEIKALLAEADIQPPPTLSRRRSAPD